MVAKRLGWNFQNLNEKMSVSHILGDVESSHTRSKEADFAFMEMTMNDSE
jgi:hypothetical protein